MFFLETFFAIFFAAPLKRDDCDRRTEIKSTNPKRKE